MKTGAMVRLTVALAVVLISCATRESTERGGRNSSREFPFEFEHNRVIVPVRVGTSRVLRILLDTGMGFDGLLLYEALPESAVPGSHYEVRIPGAGSGEPARGMMAESASFTVGPVQLFRQRVVWLTDGSMSGFSSDGVMGYSLFGHWVVELDYDRMVIILHEPGTFKPDSSWAALPMQLHKNNIPWVRMWASIQGTDSAELDCYLDLPACDEVVFLVRNGAKFPLPESLESSYLGRGLSGDVYGWKGRVAWVEFDTFRFRDITASFAPDSVRSKQPGADAVVCGGLLRRFNTIYDFSGGRLYIRPSRRQ